VKGDVFMQYILYAIVAVVVLVLIWVVATYNSFIKLRNKVEEAFATMDVYLTKRYDLIPNLVETVKGYAKHESQTLEKVIAARNMAAGAKTTEEKVAGENMLQGTLKTLFAIAEAYPELKANTNFINLQGQLTEMEGEIANSRKYYNAIVKTFNTKVELFPSNLIAGLFKFTRKTMFEVEEAEQRQNVKVQF
jgi:LemA protein